MVQQMPTMDEFKASQSIKDGHKDGFCIQEVPFQAKTLLRWRLCAELRPLAPLLASAHRTVSSHDWALARGEYDCV